MYQWAIGQGGAGEATGGAVVPGGGSLVHLAVAVRDGELPKQQHQDALAAFDDPEWPAALVERVRAGAASSEYAALVGPWCGGCPVRTSCPAHPEGGRVTP